MSNASQPSGSPTYSLDDQQAENLPDLALQHMENLSSLEKWRITQVLKDQSEMLEADRRRGEIEWQDARQQFHDSKRACKMPSTKPAQPEPDEGDHTYVDSPQVTHNHYESAKSNRMVPAIIGASLLSGGLIGGAVLLSQLLDRPKIQPVEPQQGARVSAFVPGPSTDQR